MGVIHAEEDEIIEEGPIDCLPESCYKKFPIFAGDEDSPFWQGWGNLRLKTFRLIENKYFETAVITMILLSSMALVSMLFIFERKKNDFYFEQNRWVLINLIHLKALEDVHLPHRPILQDILYYMDRIFTVIFFLEMLIKWVALGFKAYFNNAWCWLDFVIVMVGVLCFV